LKAARLAAELLREDATPQKAVLGAVEVMVAEKIPAQVACRVLSVSEAGYYERRKRAPSERAARHAWLTDLIT
jgi:putative transposase